MLDWRFFLQGTNFCGCVFGMIIFESDLKRPLFVIHFEMLRIYSVLTNLWGKQAFIF